MTDKEILNIDFYDIVGIDSIFMSDEDKIIFWRKIIENQHDYSLYITQ